MSFQHSAFSKAKFVSLTLLAILALPLNSSAADEPTTCYQIPVVDSPVMGPIDETGHHEVWCYQKLSQPAGGLYIYNADSEEAKVELALIVEPDGILTHGSLHAGKITAHRTHATEFNPFSIPIQEPLGFPKANSRTNSDFSDSANKVLKFLLSERPPYVSMAVIPGQTQAYLTGNDLPWRGYWWPYRNQPMVSVLRKYDKFVQGRTGSNPGAANWERNNHEFTGSWWHGHCNGWAASAILRAQPRVSKRDPTTGTVFSVSDIKGVLAEKDYCASVAFFGRRYNGRSGDDIRDIYPANFHRTLTYYIGSVKKPVAADYRRDSVVDTHIVSGYSMNIQRRSATSYSVTARVKFHKYDSSRSSTPGIAPSYTRTYRYTLTTNSSGAITGGRWLSGNPDFLWVPLSTPNCTRSNPRVTNQWTNAILRL